MAFTAPTHSSSPLRCRLIAIQTTAGTATAVAATDTTIDISMPYSGDGNANNSYTVEYKLSSIQHLAGLGRQSEAPYRQSVYRHHHRGLTPGAGYDVRLTYNDADGVSGTNPQTISPQANATTAGAATTVAVSGTTISDQYAVHRG